MPFNKYSPAQRKLAAVAAPRKKITGADFAVLRNRKKIGKKKCEIWGQDLPCGKGLGQTDV